MRISFQWLCELVDLPDDVGPAEVAERLTLAGLEVEGVHEIGRELEGVVVARILEKEAHPNADRLTVCTVDAGQGQPLKVVCGAANHSAGDLALLAPVGVRLPGDVEIRATKIRGVQSFGMLCSASELGLEKEGEGILLLDEKDGAKVGMSAREALHRDDTVLEVAVTPNRPDALCHVGIARELAALFAARPRFQSPTCAERGGPVEDIAHVAIEDLEGCPRYACRIIENVKVGNSPPWLVARLEACGVRAINNIVDATNYAMLERGIPLHAFDLDRIGRARERATVIVRRAKEGETLRTLDDKERALDADDVVIADPNGPIAIAGVMGGADTEVRASTTRILLEGAYFHPARVRRTARRLGIHSEASHRFERGCDPNGVRAALDRAASLMADAAGGVVGRGYVDVYPRKIEPALVPLRPKRAAEILGIPQKLVDEQAASKLLLSLGLEVAAREGDGVRFRVPTFRPDLTREIDLIEELIRLIGYDKVPATLPSRGGVAKGLFHERRQRVEEVARGALEAAGYTEAINLAFVSPSVLDLLGSLEAAPIRLRNPLGEELSVLRPSLLPALLEGAALNQRRQSPSVRLYEIGTVFRGRNPRGAAPRIDDPDGPPGGDSWANERPMIAGVVAGEVGVRGFDRRPVPADFYDVKGVVEALCDRLGIDVGFVQKTSAAPRVGFRPAGDEARHLHPRARAHIEIARAGEAPVVVGSVGELHPDVIARFDLRGPALAFELDAGLLADVAPARPRAAAPPRYPAVKRDFALVLDEGVAAAALGDALAQNESVRGILEDLDVFDVYQGEHVPKGKKSIALSVTFRAQDRTLTDEEVGKAAGALIEAARSAFSAEIRS